MTIEIKAPVFPESIKEGVISQIYAELGLGIRKDEVLFDIETDKVVLEDGRMTEYIVEPGKKFPSKQIIGYFEAGEVLKSEVKSPSDYGHASPLNLSEYSSNKTKLAVVGLTCFVFGAIFGVLVMTMLK